MHCSNKSNQIVLRGQTKARITHTPIKELWELSRRITTFISFLCDG
jgi:hypothetical protein